MNEKRKVGRPMKYGEESPVRIDTTTSQFNKTRIKLSGKSATYFLEFGLNALLGDPEDRKLDELRDKLSKIEPEYLELKAQIIRIEERKKQLDDIRRKKEVQDRYMHSAFSEIVRHQQKHGKILISMSWIEEAYGIMFDESLVNRHFEETVNDLNLPSDYVVEKYHIEKVRKGNREDKIMVDIVKKDSGKDGDQ